MKSESLEKIFKDKKLYQQALTHKSWVNEHPDDRESNERLEFLGDAVLEFIVSGDLYKKFPDKEEGYLTALRANLVNTTNLSQIALSLDLGNKLYLSKGEEESKGRENTSLLADSFEAFIGALFLDQEIEEVTKFITRVLLPRAEFYSSNKALKDIKSLLQEIIQAKKQLSPIYKVLKEEGPAHKKIFTVGAYEDKVLLGKGIGKSKQEAEKDAAKQALLILKSK